jgi:hypothetical protein
MMPSAVRVQQLAAPQAAIPADNSRGYAAAGQLGATAVNLYQQKKAEGYADDLMNQAQPTEEQIQSQQIDMQERQQVQKAQEGAQQSREIVKQNGWMREMISDPVKSKQFSYINKINPEMAKAVVDTLKARDAYANYEVAQAAQKANDDYTNYLAILQKHGKEAADQFIEGQARSIYQQGGDVRKYMSLTNMDADGAAAYADSMRAATGTVLQIGDIKSASEMFAKIDPTKHTPESVRAFQQTGDYGDLVSVEETPEPMTEYQRQSLAIEKSKLANEENAGPDFGDVQSLRKEFAAETKGFVDVNDAYGRVKASAADPSPAGDMALIFNYMKVLDPGSTVREGEFATAKNAGSVSQSIIAKYNSAINGEMLEDKQRKDFVDRAGRLYNQAAENHKKRVNEYTRLAEKRGFDPEEVITNRALFDNDDSQDTAAVLAEARAAIAAGADPAAVKARLNEMGYK